MSDQGDSRNSHPDYVQTITVTDAQGNIKELVFPKALDLDRPKRLRTTFSKDQLEVLESVFKLKQYVVGKERTKLAKQLSLSENQIKVWFQNRRTKHKKDEDSSSNMSSSLESPSTTKKCEDNQLSLSGSDLTNHLQSLPMYNNLIPNLNIPLFPPVVAQQRRDEPRDEITLFRPFCL